MPTTRTHGDIGVRLYLHPRHLQRGVFCPLATDALQVPSRVQLESLPRARFKEGKLLATPPKSLRAVQILDVFWTEVSLSYNASRDLPVIILASDEPEHLWCLLVDVDHDTAWQVLARLGEWGGILRNFSKTFALEPTSLGRGASAAVYRVLEKQPGGGHRRVHQMVGKVLRATERSASEAEKTKEFRDEASLLIAAQGHPNVVKFFGFFQHDAGGNNPQYAQMAMLIERGSGGDLWDAVQRCGVFSEDRAREVMRGLLSALAHIHMQRVVHRDVKAENVVLHDDGRAMLADFGIASNMDDMQGMSRRCGSPGYVAPEVYRGLVYSGKVDCFSAGALLHFLLSSRLPYDGTVTKTTLRRMEIGEIDLPREIDRVSDSCKELVRALLQGNPGRRPSASDALKRPFFAKEKPETVQEAVPAGSAAATFGADGSRLPNSRAGGNSARERMRRFFQRMTGSKGDTSKGYSSDGNEHSGGDTPEAPGWLSQRSTRSSTSSGSAGQPPQRPSTPKTWRPWRRNTSTQSSAQASASAQATASSTPTPGASNSDPSPTWPDVSGVPQRGHFAWPELNVIMEEKEDSQVNIDQAKLQEDSQVNIDRAKESRAASESHAGNQPSEKESRAASERGNQPSISPTQGGAGSAGEQRARSTKESRAASESHAGPSRAGPQSHAGPDMTKESRAASGSQAGNQPSISPTQGGAGSAGEQRARSTKESRAASESYAGPSRAGPQSHVGPDMTKESRAGPQSHTGPSRAGPQSHAGPSRAGPQSHAGPDMTKESRAASESHAGNQPSISPTQDRPLAPRPPQEPPNAQRPHGRAVHYSFEGDVKDGVGVPRFGF